MKRMLFGIVVLLGVLGLAQPTACDVVSDAAVNAVIGTGFVTKNTPMNRKDIQGYGTMCSRRKGKILVQVVLLPGITDKGMNLQDLLKQETQDATQDSSSKTKITVTPQKGLGDEAFSTTFETSEAPIKFTHVAVRKGKTVFFVQVFNTADPLADALKLAKGGVSRLP